MSHSIHIPTKGEMIAHYCEREVREFIQLDHFGDDIYSSITHDLMHGSPVRVMIPPSTTRKEALRMLKEIRKVVKTRFKDGPIVEASPSTTDEEPPF